MFYLEYFRIMRLKYNKCQLAPAAKFESSKELRLYGLDATDAVLLNVTSDATPIGAIKPTLALTNLEMTRKKNHIAAHCADVVPVLETGTIDIAETQVKQAIQSSGEECKSTQFALKMQSIQTLNCL